MWCMTDQMGPYLIDQLLALPSRNRTLLITNFRTWNSLMCLQRCCADRSSLNTMARVVSREPQLLDFLVRKRTVANVDSIGLVGSAGVSSAPPESRKKPAAHRGLFCRQPIAFGYLSPNRASALSKAAPALA